MPLVDSEPITEGAHLQEWPCCLSVPALVGGVEHTGLVLLAKSTGAGDATGAL